MKANLNHHMLKHPETADSYRYIACVHCNATYKTKKSLDDHTIRKHPDSITCITSKVHKCAYCTYKTTVKGHFTEHMLKHSETTHPHFIASVSSKMHECTYCTYKTTMKSNFAKHLLKHSQRLRADKLMCTACNKQFRHKGKLDDHTIRKHPHLIASVTNKIHECSRCAFKTVIKATLAKHIKKHPKIADSNNLVRCIHCNATYKSRTTLNDHVIHNHPDFIASISSKIYQCKYCTYKTTRKSHFVKHSLVHPETVDSHKLSKCIHCNAIYKHKIGLDDHILRQHPELIASVSSKMHECTHCAFKTVLKANLALHMLEHHETADRFCNKAFRQKGKLDEHTVRKHPHLIASVTNKIHECTRCAFKTVMKASLARHVMKHPEIADSNKLIRCNHYSRKLNKCIRCNTEYKHKIGLDEHILRQHPELIASVSNKMHECTHCAFKTVFKDNLTVHMVEHHETADISVSRKIYECTLCAFKTVSKLNSDRHMLEHPEMVDRCTFRTCVQCNATFKSRQGLNDHTLKKHPESIGSISSKIYECPQCTFKTVMKSYLTRHMLKHPETADRCKFSACVHCNATFKSKPSLVDHTLRKHPDSVESNSIRIYECTHCAYKTCLKRSFTKHILKHP
nr:unnamed protein product [Callosobruchus analis]